MDWNAPAAMEDVPISNAPPRRQVSSADIKSKSPTGILGASSNLVNSIVGAGIIGIPYAFKQSGFVVGILLLILVAYCTDKSLRIMIDLASFHPTLHSYGILTFEDLMKIPFGNAGYRFILLSMFIMAYGAMIAYLIIIKDTIPKVFGSTGSSFWEKELIMTITSLFIILPLALMRDISTLAFTSFISVTADLALVFIIVLFAPVKSTIADYGGFSDILHDFWINDKLFIGLGVLSTAMACQHSAFLISGSLRHLTPQRWAVVTSRSLLVASVMTIVLGIFGYFGYLDQTQGNVLNNFPEQSVAINSGRALLGITMYLTYPMESLVARHVIIQLFYQGNMDNTRISEETGEVLPEQKFCNCLGRRERVTVLLFLCTLVPALLVDDLGPVLSITGSLGASCIAYIAPGLVYLGVHGGHFLQWVDSEYAAHHKLDDSSGQAVELPVVGDATARISPAVTTATTRRRRPFWWWLFGLPLWVALAQRGERGTREFIASWDREQGAPEPPESPDVSATPLVFPNRRDFCISIALIVFGIVAATCGLLSNIYVQVHDIFFTPL
jgi:solute carrier family 38 (sodium-coupled neutral amino acid transporter), member 11